MTLQEALAQQKKPSKYHSRKVTIDGITFDSAKEARRYGELKLLEKAGEIYDLQRQVPFVVIPVQKDENGKVIEREVKYIADYVYMDSRTHKQIVEDVKGCVTEVFRIKRKLMLYMHNIKIKEVR